MSRSMVLGRLAAIIICIAGALWAASRLPSVSTVDTSLTSFTGSPDASSGFRVDNQYLYRMQALFRPTLEANRKDFTGRLGPVKGFGAGDVYPQIWLRDSATLLPTSRFYFPVAYLTSWLEEHLAHQGSGGQLYDWIAAGPVSHFTPYAPKAEEIYGSGDDVLSADKNTVAADQESSAVVAASRIYDVTGDKNWLRNEIEGRRLIERLDAGLRYLVRERADPESGLIVSGFSADWGDVSPTHPDTKAIYLDDATPRVIGLYTNSLFYFAASKLSELHAVLKEDSQAEFWSRTAETTKESVNRHLWQEDRGFYRMHAVLTPALTAGWPDDSNIFAMGGNALAVLYGIADQNQATSIFERAQERRNEVGMSTVSGSLLPAFPRGFFAHPMLKEEYVYQNGGQWDWFGGRFVLSEFERGFTERAHRQLVQIARKVVSSGGLYEWQSRDGKGRGSRNYAGSAGALGAACFQGLFGVYLTAGALELRVRLGDWPGQIQLYQPATETYVRYRYRYDEKAHRLDLRYESNSASEGGLSILLPKGGTVSGLWVDEEERSFSVESLGEDRYVKLSTDWSPHQLRVQLNEH